MKPNDKAIAAGVKLCWDCPRATPSMIRDILTAAYDAQFQSEDYAGLVKELRDWDFCWPSYSIEQAVPKAADALEAVLAERDTLKSKLKTMTENWEEAVKTNSKLCHIHLKERDAALARLAPVEDEALVEIAADAIDTPLPGLTWGEREGGARAAIAAVRPHIEASERERCAKIADKYVGEWHSDLADACARAIAAAIRSGTGCDNASTV